MEMSIRRRGMARLARRNAERRLAVLGCMRLLGLAMKRVLSQKGIVFLLFQTVRRLRALLVTRRHVTGDRFSESFRFGAFQGDDLLRHKLICSEAIPWFQPAPEWFPPPRHRRLPRQLSRIVR